MKEMIIIGIAVAGLLLLSQFNKGLFAFAVAGDLRESVSAKSFVKRFVTDPAKGLFGQAIAFCISLAEVAEHCGANAGGVTTIAYGSLAKDVATIPAAAAGQVTTDITMEATKNFVELHVIEDAGGLVMEAVGEVGGKSYMNTYTGFIAKMTAAKDVVLGPMINGGYIFLIKDRNGIMRIIGDKDRPAQVTVSGATGENGEARNGYTITVMYRSAQLPFEYTGDLPIA